MATWQEHVANMAMADEPSASLEMSESFSILLDEVYRRACDCRMAWVTEFREAANIHKSDDWQEEEDAITRCRAAIEGGEVWDLDDYALLQLRVGLELMITAPERDFPADLYDEELIAHRLIARATDHIPE